MEFAQITYTKTVEGNFEVQLVNNNTVIARITFPTEFLASEYVDIKSKIKSSTDALIAEVTANLQKIEGVKVATSAAVTSEFDNVVAKVEDAKVTGVAEATSKADGFVAKVEAEANKIKDAVETDIKKVEDKAESVINSIKLKVEKQAPIDTSAKVVKSEDNWQESAKAKVGKDTIIDTSAKVVVTE